ncbi:hypothetical protein LUZ60_014444 [Juncus effusus]|nr:hypothetical protein LUZ60_014444 [Juncus effusus]
MVGYSSCMPNWLESLLGEEFFTPCMVHETMKRNEKNIFCLDCCSSLCPHCFPHHHLHRLLQIRRYMYHDVVRVEEFGKLMKCSSIQSYIANGAKVVFLNQRSQANLRIYDNSCLFCERSLPDQYIYCCISCKANELLRNGEGLARELKECNILSIDECQFTTESILESPEASSSSSGGGNIVISHKKFGLAGTEASSRRKKGVPVRAPLF